METLSRKSEGVRTPSSGLVACLSGRGRLSVAYWGYGVGGSLAFAVLVVIISLALMGGGSSTSLETAGNSRLAVFLGASSWAFLAYQVFVAILVWRNAFNVENPIWGWLARGLVVSAAIILGFRMLMSVT
jgi:peptidoglycan/LPS O-acetylase OafA/YrhL